MNWSLLLSEYPCAVLTEELPLLTLATLESEGFTSGSGVALALDTESERGVDSALRLLHADKLVKTDSGGVRISSRGKLFLDHLGISRYVILEFLSKVVPAGTDLDPLVVLLMQYRNWAFSHYQHSIKAFRVWESVRMDLNLTGHHQPGEGDIVGAALLLRDIRHWLLYQTPATTAFPSIDPRYLALLKINTSKWGNVPTPVRLGEGSEGPALSAWFHTARDWAIGAEYYAMPKDIYRRQEGEVDSELRWLGAFSRLQRLSTPDSWYQTWKFVWAKCLSSARPTLETVAAQILQSVTEGPVTQILQSVTEGPVTWERWWADAGEDEAKLTAGIADEAKLTAGIAEDSSSMGLSIRSFTTHDRDPGWVTGQKHSGSQRGTVKWFNNAKGYGFISRSGGEDVFVHSSALKTGGLQQGQTVEFDVIKGPKGLQADNVRPSRKS